MKKISVFCFIIFFIMPVKAQLAEWSKMKRLDFKEVRTVSDRILVAFFLGPDLNVISTDPSGWALNGIKPERIERFITPNWSGIDFGYEHHIYLFMQEPLIQGKKYMLKTPYGEYSFRFN